MLDHGKAPSMPYQPRYKSQHRFSEYHGQRKLFDTTLEFLTHAALTAPALGQPTIVYAGAAEGTNTGIIADRYFPDAIYHLYDPRPSALKTGGNIHVYQDFFTDDVAQMWAAKKIPNLLFISDIRYDDKMKFKLGDADGGTSYGTDGGSSSCVGGVDDNETIAKDMTL